MSAPAQTATIEIMNDVFKAYDVRGLVGDELNEDLYRRTGAAFADWLESDGPVAVGRDMRPSSEGYAKALIEGLTAQGRNVIDLGLVTTDITYFAVGSQKLAGGIMVTASHNPSNYNGMKFCREEAQGIGLENGLAEIRDKAIENDFQPAAQAGSVKSADLTEAWLDHALSFIDIKSLKPMKLAIDAGNGMAGQIIPELEPYVPFEITPLYFELDGSFPNHEANPLNFETLADIKKVIVEKKLDGGIAFDGDGDRAFLLDEDGKVLTGSEMTAMIAECFLKKHPGSKVTYDVRVSKTVPEIVSELGGESIRAKVGHSTIKQVMRQNDAVFGGEASGHYYFRDNWYADSGLIASLIALEVLSKSGKKLSELRTNYLRYAIIPETNFTVEDKVAALERLREEFADNPMDELDGLTFTLPSGAWFNARLSNTEPVLRLNAEAPNQDQLDELVDRVKKLINT